VRLALLAVLVALLLASLLLALRRQWSWLAVMGVMLAVPVQLLGLISTCRDGITFTFLAGASVSAPLLLGAIGWLWRAHRARLTDARAALIAAAASLAMIGLTRDAWLNSLTYRTPCGEHFTAHASHPLSLAVIVVGYLLLPLALIACALWTALRAPRPVDPRG
jgi:hypothetical protein